MLEWIREGNNFIIILTVGLFLIFALIGFLVDNLKNKKNKESELLTQTDLPVVDANAKSNEIESANIPLEEAKKEDNIPNVEPVKDIPEINLEQPKDNNN